MNLAIVYAALRKAFSIRCVDQTSLAIIAMFRCVSSQSYVSLRLFALRCELMLLVKAAKKKVRSAIWLP
jgi:hypothetical protein